MKRKYSLFSVFSGLLVAVFMLAAYSSTAEAHSSKYHRKHSSGFTFGFGSHGAYGGIVSSRRYSSKSHCHGHRYCHRHSNRGYHDHRKRGVTIYPRHTAPRYRRHGSGSAHVNWCFKKYRSYDIYTDTFQPYKGRRKRCNSPFD